MMLQMVRRFGLECVGSSSGNGELNCSGNNSAMSMKLPCQIRFATFPGTGGILGPMWITAG